MEPYISLLLSTIIYLLITTLGMNVVLENVITVYISILQSTVASQMLYSEHPTFTVSSEY